MTNSQQLLAEYARTRSDAVFQELVARYINLVYSTAIRLTHGDTHRAEDVTQIVFAGLAAKAPTLSPEVMLGGWLHRHACYVVANTLRSEHRRQSRERQAMEMNTLHPDPAPDFTQVAPILDEAINALSETDRTAVLLRFYEQRDFHSVAEAIGGNENAARMRVNRALDKLQELLKQRGVMTSAAALAVVLSANSVQAAPAGLALSISTASAVGTKTVAAAGWYKVLLTLVLTAAVGTGIYQARRPAKTAPPSLPKPTLKIKGHISVVTDRRGRQEQTFEMEFNERRWDIKIFGTGQTNSPLFYKSVFDGADIYSLTAFNTNTLAQRQAKNDAVGTVKTRKIPDDDINIQALWLAYGSGEFFADGTGWRFPALMHFSVNPKSTENLKFLQARGTLLGGPISLPDNMVFWNEGKMLSNHYSAPILAPNPAKLPSDLKKPIQGRLELVGTTLENAPAPYDQGYTNLIYEILEKTNCAGLTVPSHFILKAFLPKPDGKTTADLRSSLSVEVFADAVTQSSNAITVPVIGPRTVITDMRSPSGRRITYWPTNNHWLSTNEASDFELNTRASKK